MFAKTINLPWCSTFLPLTAGPRPEAFVGYAPKTIATTPCSIAASAFDDVPIHNFLAELFQPEKRTRELHEQNLERISRFVPFYRLLMMARMFPHPDAGKDVDVKEVALHLSRHALACGFRSHSISELCRFWDRVARLHRYEGLESLLMLTRGYEASTLLPIAFRKHRIPGAFLHEHPQDVRRSHLVADRIVRYRQLLLDNGINAHEAHGFAVTMANTALQFPECSEIFEASDFAHLPAGHVFQPTRSRAENLWKHLRGMRQDPFPDLSITPLMRASAIVNRLRLFLHFYRSSERIFRDGGVKQVHCTHSAALVANLLLLKGFDAFPLWTHQTVPTKDDDRVTRSIVELCTLAGLNPAHFRKLLQTFRSDMSLPHFTAKLRELGSKAHNARELQQRLKALPSSKLHELVSRPPKGSGHMITALRVEGHTILIDIDGQQFGKPFDRVRMFDPQSALQEGIILFENPEESWQHLSGHDFLQPLRAKIQEEQWILREYQKLLFPEDVL